MFFTKNSTLKPHVVHWPTHRVIASETNLGVKSFLMRMAIWLNDWSVKKRAIARMIADRIFILVLVYTLQEILRRARGLV